MADFVYTMTTALMLHVCPPWQRIDNRRFVYIDQIRFQKEEEHNNRT